ncbi:MULTISPECIES: hypothetical protein [Pseudomonas]|uniref:Uncharacterized protein n=1 Tax=Pseudomonas wuhanensis TaxID=2954098 RepID=A0ABY9GKP0_9PSED|nr:MULTISPECIES: hypothetical protein [unclassified Pseudomonas]WLI10522.1 hypothetical protein PSH65_19900 [Pseudomonas sp. FP603]WLI16335.1 hypothetical protein PSH88_18520 [Pseudomonas sp. FP607]
MLIVVLLLASTFFAALTAFLVGRKIVSYLKVTTVVLINADQDVDSEVTSFAAKKLGELGCHAVEVVASVI